MDEFDVEIKYTDLPNLVQKFIYTDCEYVTMSSDQVVDLSFRANLTIHETKQFLKIWIQEFRKQIMYEE